MAKWHCLWTSVNPLDDFFKIAFKEFNNDKYQESIEAFKQSLALRKDWKSYQGLGLALHLTWQHQQAIDAFKQSLALKEDWKSYQGLGWALGKLGKVESAIRASRFIYRSGDRSPHLKIDPFVAQNNKKVIATRDLIQKIQWDLSEIEFAFHPSFLPETEEENQLQSWKHLVHIHIPKCAGSNFINPLAELPIYYAQFYQKSRIKPSKSSRKNYLWHGNLGGKIIHDAFMLEAFDGVKLNKLQGSLFANHGAKHSLYCEKLSEADICAKKVCLVRDPSQRLYSHVRMLGRNSHSKGDLLKRCMKEASNAMDRYIYDYNLYEDQEEFPFCDPTDYKNCESIDFLDIRDKISISRVKSSFLSATLMPNLVQYNRINANRKIISGTLGERDFQEVHKELVLRGCLERDALIDIEYLKCKTKKRLTFPKIVQTGVVLHPLTFIYSTNCTGKIILTEDFILDPVNAVNF